MEREENNTSKPLNQRVTLRTVDNFQGEETKIVIISLVRNCSVINKVFIWKFKLVLVVILQMILVNQKN
ncbi:hypothetical protein GLOIN_2v1493357, partial [Rhizophagus irregularis DAOM 181602=DAOM 197198]